MQRKIEIFFRNEGDPVTNLKQRYSVVSLFCGAGGLDMGFENRGFRTIWANDIDKHACETHRRWSKTEVVCGDIAHLDLAKIPRADVIIGGFPCQGFSLAGPRKLDDSRNSLYRHFVQLVEQQKPQIFVAENVKGILTLGKGQIIDAILKDFERKGYRVSATLVNAADYGVPQIRWRVIIVGVRKDLDLEFRMPSSSGEKVVLRDVLGSLPPPEPDEICEAPYSSRYMSRNRKKGWNEFSFTIPAMAKQAPLHPSSPDMIKVGVDHFVFGEGTSRRLSYREAAAIQTFPAEMEFCGNLTKKYLQIGNAVPVRLAESVASRVYELLERVK
ncbi:MAG: DNA cytosine methyltransferase [Planctomycetia bacterium]|nr:DNA cytosine methyltransferase [Planctomycetia bacterium]